MEIFSQYRWLWLVVALAGFAVSGYYYLQAFAKLSASRAGGSRQPGRRGPGKPEKAPGRLVTPDPKQQSLLDRSGTSEAHDRQKTEAMPSKGIPTYGVNPVQTTEIATRRVAGETDEEHSLGLNRAIAEALEESLGDELGAEAEPPVSDAATAEVESFFDGLGDGDEDASVAAEATPPEPSEKDKTRHRRGATGTEVLRRAERHEELGLHFGIPTDEQLREAKRLATAELDDILARLDSALSEPGPKPEATAAEQATTETLDRKPEPQQGDRGYQELATRSTITAARDPDGKIVPKIGRDRGYDELSQRPTAKNLEPASPTEGADQLAADGEAEAETEVELDADTETAADKSTDPAGADSKSSARPAGDIPSWARADTFDDDAEQQPKQNNLFD